MKTQSNHRNRLAGLRVLGVVLLLLGLTGCLIEDEAKDGLREIRAQVTEASLSIDSEGQGTVDFTFHYLLGVIDNAGIERVVWTYALVDTDENEIISATEDMREAQENIRKIYVKGTRPRTLVTENVVLDPERTYILWITVIYRELVLKELLIPVKVGVPYVETLDYGDIPEISTD